MRRYYGSIANILQIYCKYIYNIFIIYIYYQNMTNYYWCITYIFLISPMDNTYLNIVIIYPEDNNKINICNQIMHLKKYGINKQQSIINEMKYKTYE